MPKVAYQVQTTNKPTPLFDKRNVWDFFPKKIDFLWLFIEPSQMCSQPPSSDQLQDRSSREPIHTMLLN